MLFGHEGAPPAFAAASAARATGDDRPAQTMSDGEFPGAAVPGTPGHARPASAAPPGAGGHPDTSGVRVERPDPTMIPARDDAGNHAPPYPDTARAAHIGGTVLIRLHISETGAVTWVEKLQSSGDASLDAAAELTLAHWHFLPAQQDGLPVPSYRDQPVIFAIE